MQDILVNCLGGLSLPRKSVVWSTDYPDMTLAVYHGGKITTHNNLIDYLQFRDYIIYMTFR